MRGVGGGGGSETSVPGPLLRSPVTPGMWVGSVVAVGPGSSRSLVSFRGSPSYAKDIKR